MINFHYKTNTMKLPIVIQGFEFTLLGIEDMATNPMYTMQITHGQFKASAKIGKCPGNNPAIYNIQILSTHGLTCLTEYLEDLYTVYRNSSSEIYMYFKNQIVCPQN